MNILMSSREMQVRAWSDAAFFSAVAVKFRVRVIFGFENDMVFFGYRNIYGTLPHFAKLK
jgi:hypothetical protein